MTGDDTSSTLANQATFALDGRWMHPSSYENMQRCKQWYGVSDFGRIVDIGSAGVNGTYRELFAGCGEYVGIDMQTGPNVDVVLDDPYVLPIADGYVDLVICGQMLEHCAHFWRVFTEIARVLKPGGRLFLIAPSAGPIHYHPVDCYRFYPDAYAALAQWSGLRLVHVWMDPRGPWRDLVGVFQKGGDLTKIVAPPRAALAAPSIFQPHSDPAAEAVGGARKYLDILADIHRLMAPKLYVEIGVRRGASLRLARCRTIGIDPQPELDEMPITAEIFSCASDDFFFFYAENAISRPIDLAFIDGMHHAEFVYRDFLNLEPLMSPKGVIVIDDVFPNHPLQALRERRTRNWCGDVWRFADLLVKTRRDLKLTWLDSAPTGLLVISQLKHAHPALADRYNQTIRELLSRPDPDIPEAYLKRSPAVVPNEANLRAALGLSPASVVS